MTAVQPKTYVEMVRRLRQEGRGAGSVTTPTTLVNVVDGDVKDQMDWIAESWNRIQMAKRNWRWMFDDVEIDVTAGVRDYSMATIFPVADDLARFAHWKRDNFQYKTDAGGLASERPVAEMPWESYAQVDYGTVTPAERPSRVIVLPDNSIRLMETPTVDGTLKARYYKGPQALVNDTDVPEFNAKYHMLIVWDALLDHAVAELSQEQLARATDRKTDLWYSLINNEIEPVRMYGRTMVG